MEGSNLWRSSFSLLCSKQICLGVARHKLYCAVHRRICLPFFIFFWWSHILSSVGPRPSPHDNVPMQQKEEEEGLTLWLRIYGRRRGAREVTQFLSPLFSTHVAAAVANRTAWKIEKKIHGSEIRQTPEGMVYTPAAFSHKKSLLKVRPREKVFSCCLGRAKLVRDLAAVASMWGGSLSLWDGFMWPLLVFWVLVCLLVLRLLLSLRKAKKVVEEKEEGNTNDATEKKEPGRRIAPCT